MITNIKEKSDELEIMKAEVESLKEKVKREQIEYGKFAGHKNLGAATYNFTYNNFDEERGVFSFCMCPGGVIKTKIY